MNPPTPATHLAVTGVKSRSHLVYLASYVRSLLAAGGTVRLSFIEVPAFLAAAPVTVADARAMLPDAETLSIEPGLPGWRFAPGSDAVYASVGAPGLKVLLAMRKAEPRRRIRVVVTDEGIGTYGSFASRRAAIARQGAGLPKAGLRAALVQGSSRLLTSQRWAAYECRGTSWVPNPAVAQEFRRDLGEVAVGSDDTAVILTQPFVDLGLIDEAQYVAYVERLAQEAAAVGLRPLVRPHPAERTGRYANLELMDGVGTADLDPAVVRARVVLGGPSTAIVNLSAVYGARTVWVSEPSLAYLDTEVSRDQAGIFRAFLGEPVQPDDVRVALQQIAAS